MVGIERHSGKLSRESVVRGQKTKRRESMMCMHWRGDRLIRDFRFGREVGQFCTRSPELVYIPGCSCCRDGTGTAQSTRLRPGMGGVLTHVRQMATAIASTPSP